MLKSFLGNGSKDRELSEEMRAVLQEMQQERGRFEVLVKSAHAAAERLKQLDEPIAATETAVTAATSRLEELEQRFAAMVQIVPQIESLDERASGLAQGQQRAMVQVTEALDQAVQIRSTFEEIGRKVDMAMDLKQRLEGFLEIEKPFQVLKGDGDALRGQVEATGDQLGKLREQHDRLLDAHRTALQKMEAMDRRREELSRDMTDKERRVASVESAVKGLDGVQRTIDDVKRDMTTLKALGELVQQKSTALEAQRDGLEKALARANDLHTAMRQIDAGVHQQVENEKFLGKLQDDVSVLKTLHETVIERTAEITQLQRSTDEYVHGTRSDLVHVEDEMKKTVARFDFESRGLESVSQRVTDLRGALTEFETRYKGLSEASHTVGELKSQTLTISSNLQTFSEHASRVDIEITKLQAMRRELDETTRVANLVGTHVTRIAESQPAAEAAMRDLTALRGAHASVKDALEQTQIAHDEIAKMRDVQSETRTWIAGVERSLGEMKEQVGELNTLKPTIEVVQTQARHANESLAAIESRREFVEELQVRLAQLGNLSGNLDERGRELQARMEAAEQRFVTLGAEAEEAERLSQSIAAVTASVLEAERKTGEVVKKVAASETRAKSVEALADRAQSLKKELDQRRHALDEAAKDLQKAGVLRQEAADSAQQLGELATQFNVSLKSADGQLGRVGTLTQQLEDRTSNLRNVDQRLSQFEERMARWELVEQNIARSLEQIAARQGTIESLQADLDRMSTMAEKTATDVREITSAQREVEESRGVLDEVMSRLTEIRETSTTLDERKRQMNKAEERLARADALLVDVRSSLEALQGQKVMVDQAVEKAGSLRNLLKQAEGVIEGLREEREMSSKVRAAIRLVDENDGDDEDGEGTPRGGKAKAA